MKYRVQDHNGDYTYGQRPPQFYVNSPDAVRQAILTRLRLMTGEWLLDTADGTPYNEQVLGTHTDYTRDPAIKSRILGTPGVNALLAYSSTRAADRSFTVSATVDTIYGVTTLTSVITG